MNKPVVTGSVDGNIYFIMGAAQRELRRAGQGNKTDEMIARVKSSTSYEMALSVVMEYVDFDLD